MDHLHEGHLGEVTKGWGSNLTTSPPPPSPNPSPKPDKTTETEQEGPKTSLAPIFKKLRTPVKLKIQENKNPETSSTGVRDEKKRRQARITDLFKTTEQVPRTSSTRTVQQDPVQKQGSTTKKNIRKEKNNIEEKKCRDERNMKGFWTRYAQKSKNQKDQNEKKSSEIGHAPTILRREPAR